MTRLILYSLPAAWLIGVGMALAQGVQPACQAEQTQLNIVTNNRAEIEKQLARFAVALEATQKERDALKAELEKVKDAVKKDEPKK